MNFIEKITELRNNIEQQLKPLIDNDYILYDLPYHNNIGDLLIWEGELSFLKQLPHRMLDYGSMHTYKHCKLIDTNTIILLHGGGNFGDIWRSAQNFRLKIIEQYPENKIVIFPQTIFYNNTELIKTDAEIMRKHKNLTICARDKVSYELLKKHFTNPILLVPDMAFCILPKALQKMEHTAENKTLFLKRTDKELADLCYDIPSQYPVTVADWSTMEHTDLVQLGLKAASIPHKLFGITKFTNWYGMNIYRPRLIRKGVKLISHYKEIYTTRLHVAILSILLEKPFHFLDNSYGKNKTFFDTWLSDLNDIEFIQ